MVLWEIALGTAYFLGLRRTYRHALRIQRRLVRPNHPSLRQFLHRRIRSVFDVAVIVHKKVQERDVEVGRDFRKWLLHWLDCIKASAEKYGTSGKLTMCNSSIPKPATSSTPSPKFKMSVFNRVKEERKGRLLFTPLKFCAGCFPSVPMMMQQTKLTGMRTQFRHVSGYTTCAPTLEFRAGRSGGVFRQDIAQWMLA